MQAKITRHVLERIYGFAEPTTTREGRVTYECAYCGVCADHGSLPHVADCPYWAAQSAFATPAAARLVEQVLRGA
jgi:hypothetical protein